MKEYIRDAGGMRPFLLDCLIGVAAIMMVFLSVREYTHHDMLLCVLDAVVCAVCGGLYLGRLLSRL